MIRAIGAPSRVHVVVNSQSKHALRIADSVDTGLSIHKITTSRESDESENAPFGTHEVTGVPGLLSTDLILVIGGDGTMLRAAELGRESGAAILGVNLGHVGFLAEAEEEDLQFVIDAIAGGHWSVEERLALDVMVFQGSEVVDRTWALNEISLEKHDREKMISVLAHVDDHPLSRWGCDGVICATPTGSTAYAFSAGGPIVWPEVSALLLVPISAHSLFARPSVIAPTSVIRLELSPEADAVMWADGRRMIAVAAGSSLEVRANDQPVRFARLVTAPFTDRLVAKFQLPVEGWRGVGK
jgi:NAD+ kinase